MLENLSLSRIARNRSESVRPDLWADYMLAPVLGTQGNFLFSPSGTIASAVNGQWVMGPETCLYLASANQAYIDLGSSTQFDAGAKTVFIDFNGTTHPNAARLLAAPSEYTNDYQITFASGGVVATVGLGDDKAVKTDDKLLADNARTKLCVVWESGTDRAGISVYKSGYRVNVSNFGTSYAVSSGNFNLFRRQDGTNYLNGYLYSYQFFSRVLSPQQITELTNDPFLSLRRKTFVSFYVPSTGGVFKPYWLQTSKIIGAA